MLRFCPIIGYFSAQSRMCDTFFNQVTQIGQQFIQYSLSMLRRGDANVLNYAKLWDKNWCKQKTKTCCIVEAIWIWTTIKQIKSKNPTKFAWEQRKTKIVIRCNNKFFLFKSPSFTRPQFSSITLNTHCFFCLLYTSPSPRD